MKAISLLFVLAGVYATYCMFQQLIIEISHGEILGTFSTILFILTAVSWIMAVLVYPFHEDFELED